MRYGAAYLLAALSGSSPSAKDLEKILGSVGVDCDAALAKQVVDALSGKKVEDVVSEGLEKIGGLLSSGGGGVVAATSGGAAASAGGAAAAAPKAEEKAAEPEEESDDDMGFGLFD